MLYPSELQPHFLSLALHCLAPKTVPNWLRGDLQKQISIGCRNLLEKRRTARGSSPPGSPRDLQHRRALVHQLDILHQREKTFSERRVDVHGAL